MVWHGKVPVIIPIVEFIYIGAVATFVALCNTHLLWIKYEGLFKMS